MKQLLVLSLLMMSLAIPAADTNRSGISIDSDGGVVCIPTNGATLFILTNNIRATEGLTTLTCDSLRILARSGSGTNTQTFASLPQAGAFGSDLQSITAEGKVTIRDEKGWATGDKAVFDQTTDILTLSGSKILPHLESVDGKSHLTATSDKTVIIFDRKTGIISCVGPCRIVGSSPTDFLSLPGTQKK